MLIEDLFSSFNNSYESGDIKNATLSLMRSLGGILVTDKQEFVNLLNESEIPATMDMGEISLIDLYVENVGKNPKLALGSSLLLNMKNRMVSFDGELEDINDENVKRAYRSICDYFRVTNQNDEFSNAGGLVAGALSAGAGLADTLIKGRQRKKFGMTDELLRQKQAKQEMINKAIELRKAEQDAKIKEQEEKSKRNKRIIIASSIIGGLAIIGGIIYFLKTKKK